MNKASGHRTGKGQFSFQSQRRAMPKKVRTRVQLPSFHMLAKLWSKSFKLGFCSMWTKNFQMYNWASKRQRNQRPNRQHSLDHGESKGVTEKHLLLLHWLRESLWLTLWITTNCGKLWKRWEYPDQLSCLLRNLYASQKATVRTLHGTTGSKLGEEYTKAVYCHPVYLMSMKITS